MLISWLWEIQRCDFGLLWLQQYSTKFMYFTWKMFSSYNSPKITQQTSSFYCFKKKYLKKDPCQRKVMYVQQTKFIFFFGILEPFIHFSQILTFINQTWSTILIRRVLYFCCLCLSACLLVFLFCVYVCVNKQTIQIKKNGIFKRHSL